MESRKRSVAFQVRLSESEHDNLLRLAREDGRTPTGWVRYQIQRAWDALVKSTMTPEREKGEGE